MVRGVGAVDSGGDPACRVRHSRMVEVLNERSVGYGNSQYQNRYCSFVDCNNDAGLACFSQAVHMTDELTEHVARALYECPGSDRFAKTDILMPPWGNLGAEWQEHWEIMARAAIEAYEAGPQPAPNWKKAAEQAKEAADKVTADARVDPADLKKPYRVAPRVNREAVLNASRKNAAMYDAYWKLRRAAPQPAPAWQPIETAPKIEGYRILVVRPCATIGANMVGEDYWTDRLQGGCWAKSTPMAQPTHWMPLPEPPK